MMKFFRKHNKKLLAFFMVLLMIVFIGGSALNRLLQPNTDRVVATSDLGDISYSDRRLAEDATGILEALGFDWRRPFSFIGAVEPLEIIDWILLTREADRLGMGHSAATTRTFLPVQFGVNELARQLRRKPTRILQALAEYESIRQTARAIGGMTIPSEAEILAAARNTLEKVRVNVVLLPAKAFIDDHAEFSEAQIAAQFSKYRDREPAGGLEFGYYVQPSVKVQYIRINRDKIADRIRTAKVKYLEKKARAYYEENREQDSAFRRPVRELARSEAGAEEGDEPWLAGPPEPSVLNWEAARDIALDIVCKQEADKAAARLADWLIQRLGEEWLQVERSKDGYKKAPRAVATPDYYEGVLENVPPTIAFPDAVSTDTTDFFTQEQANDVPSLGAASFVPPRGGAVERLGTLAFRSQPIVPVVTGQKDINPSDYLALFQTSTYPLTDPDGNVYVFRVIDARKGHVPESVDEVRERVLADLRLERAYEAAKTRAESLRSCAGSSSLQEAYESDDELVALRETEEGAGSGYLEPPPFARAPEYLAARNRIPATTFVPGGLGALPTEIVERFFALEDAVERTAVIELPDRASVIVVEWVETLRADGDELLAMRERFVQQVSNTRWRAVLAEWFDPENIRARNGFRLVSN